MRPARARRRPTACGSRRSAQRSAPRARRSSSRRASRSPYTATRPDPLTLLLDFRNVGAGFGGQLRRRQLEEPDCRRVDRGGWIARPSGLTRPRGAGAAGLAPRAQRAQHGRHRIRQGRGRRRAVRDGAAEHRRRRTRCWRCRARLRPPRPTRLPRSASTSRRRAAGDLPVAAVPVAPAVAAAQVATAPVPAALPAGMRAAHAAQQAPIGRPRPRRGPINRWRRAAAASSPAIRSASTSRAPTFARCCAPSRRSAASTSSSTRRCTGTVDVALSDVPWDQALDIILAANKLGYIIDGTIVRIAPLAVLADEQSQRRKVAEEQALAGQLAGADQDAQLCEGRRTAGAADARARSRSAARCRSTRAPTRSSSPTCAIG